MFFPAVVIVNALVAAIAYKKQRQLTHPIVHTHTHIWSSWKMLGSKNKNRNIYSFFIHKYTHKMGTMKIKTDRREKNIVFENQHANHLQHCCAISSLFSFSQPCSRFFVVVWDFLDFSHSVCLSRYKVLSHCERKSFACCCLVCWRNLVINSTVVWIGCVCENLPTIPRFFYLLVNSWECTFSAMKLIPTPEQQCVCARWCINDTDNQCRWWWPGWWSSFRFSDAT